MNEELTKALASAQFLCAELQAAPALPQTTPSSDGRVAGRWLTDDCSRPAVIVSKLVPADSWPALGATAQAPSSANHGARNPHREAGAGFLMLTRCKAYATIPA